MTELLTIPELTFLFLIIVVCLAAALVWAFWELEQQRQDIRRVGPLPSKTRTAPVKRRAAADSSKQPARYAPTQPGQPSPAGAESERARKTTGSAER